MAAGGSGAPLSRLLFRYAIITQTVAFFKINPHARILQDKPTVIDRNTTFLYNYFITV